MACESRERYKKARASLWMSSPFCRRCGVITILPEDFANRIGVDVSNLSKMPDNLATIQHCLNRLDPRRKMRLPCKTRYTLFCIKCNREDGLEYSQKHHPSELDKSYDRPKTI